MEDTLRAIWKDVLGLEKLPATDESFFDLGGNSFLAARVISELEEQVGKKAEIADFYENETSDSLIKVIA